MAAEQDVKITMSADTGKALKAWQEMQKGPAKFGQELEKTGKKGGRASQSMGTDLSKLMVKWAAFSQVINLAREAIVATAQEQKKLQQDMLQTNLDVDVAYKNLYVQAAITGPGKEQEKRRAQVERAAPAIAHRVGAGSAKPVLAAAKALISKGSFSLDEALFGGGAESVIKSMIATNAPMDKAEEIGEAIGSLIGAMGLEATTKSARRIGIAVSALFQTRPVEMSHLEGFASKGGIAEMLGDMTPEMYLSALATVMPTLTAEKATTQFANLLTISGAMTPEKQKLMETIGLDSKEMDFIGPGDNLQNFVRLHKEAYAKYGKAEWQRVASAVYNKDNLAALLALMKNEEQFEKNLEAVAAGEGDYESANAYFLNTITAQSNRVKLKHEKFQMSPEGKEAARMALRKEAVDKYIERQNLRTKDSGSWVEALKRKMIPMTAEFLSLIPGMTEEEALAWGAAVHINPFRENYRDYTAEAYDATAEHWPGKPDKHIPPWAEQQFGRDKLTVPPPSQPKETHVNVTIKNDADPAVEVEVDAILPGD
tara:strand:+ start:37 stop:1659 length:1623 start_codon:yes stop_codon:yes gene_type:complete